MNTFKEIQFTPHCVDGVDRTMSAWHLVGHPIAVHETLMANKAGYNVSGINGVNIFGARRVYKLATAKRIAVALPTFKKWEMLKLNLTCRPENIDVSAISADDVREFLNGVLR